MARSFAPLLMSLAHTCVVSGPERAGALRGALQNTLWRQPVITIKTGKTRVCNAARKEPPLSRGCSGWLPPRGSKAYVQRELSRKWDKQDQLFGKLPAVSALQCAWMRVASVAGLCRCGPITRCACFCLGSGKIVPADMMRQCAIALPRCCPRAFRLLCCRSSPVAPCTCRILPLRYGGLGFAVSCWGCPDRLLGFLGRFSLGGHEHSCSGFHHNRKRKMLWRMAQIHVASGRDQRKSFRLEPV